MERKTPKKNKIKLKKKKKKDLYSIEKRRRSNLMDNEML